MDIRIQCPNLDIFLALFQQYLASQNIVYIVFHIFRRRQLSSVNTTNVLHQFGKTDRVSVKDSRYSPTQVPSDIIN